MSKTNLHDHPEATRAALALGRGVRDPRAAAWLSSVAAKWLRQREDCASPVPRGTPKLPAWAAADIEAGVTVHRFVLSDEAKDLLINVVHWLQSMERATRRKESEEIVADAERSFRELAKTSPESANAKANAWFRAAAKRAERAMKESGRISDAVEFIPSIDGYVWERATATGMIEIGVDLMNCLRDGPHSYEVRKGMAAVWGLRSPNGRHVLAMTVRKGSTSGYSNGRPTAIECKAAGNGSPYELRRHAAALLKATGAEPNCPDLLSVGALFGGRLIEDLPVEASLDDGRRLVGPIDGKILLASIEEGKVSTAVVAQLDKGRWHHNLDISELSEDEWKRVIEKLREKGALDPAKIEAQHNERSFLCSKGQSKIPFTDEIVGRKRLNAHEVIELSDGRVVLSPLDGSRLVRTIDRYSHGGKTFATAGFKMTILPKILAKEDPIEFLNAVDPKGSVFRPEAVIEDSGVHERTLSNFAGGKKSPDLVGSSWGFPLVETISLEKRGETIEIERNASSRLLIHVVRKNGRILGSLAANASEQAENAIIGAKFSQTRAVLSGNFDGDPELLSELHARFVLDAIRSLGIAPLLGSIPEFVEYENEMPARIIGKKSDELPGFGTVIKKGRSWHGVDSDGRHLWVMNSPIKGVIADARNVGDASKAAEHLVEASRILALSFGTLPHWMVSTGWNFVDGRPVLRAFPQHDVIPCPTDDVPTLRWLRTRLDDIDLAWDLCSDDSEQSILGKDKPKFHLRVRGRADGTATILSDERFNRGSTSPIPARERGIAIDALSAALGFSIQPWALFSAGRVEDPSGRPGNVIPDERADPEKLENPDGSLWLVTFDAATVKGGAADGLRVGIAGGNVSTIALPPSGLAGVPEVLSALREAIEKTKIAK